MLNIETIRARCDELLKQAIENGDEKRIERLRYCKMKFAEDDCFASEKRNRSLIYLDLNLDFSSAETTEFWKYLKRQDELQEELQKVKGFLYIIGNDGKEFPVEVMLDPKKESYYQLSYGLVCKKRFTGGGFYDTYALQGDRWVYDGSLERIFEQLEYDYTDLRIEIPGAEKK